MIIETNTELLEYIPNVFASVIGENPLYDKMLKFLKVAELWLNIEVCDHATYSALSGDQKELAKRIVVMDAFHRAIPHLDLVLTPNGFGIVSNQNVAPASKERVASLREQTLLERDLSINQLVNVLHGNSTWIASVPGRKWGKTIIQNLEISSECGEDAPSWNWYQSHIREIQGLQRMIAINFVSVAVMDRLCQSLLSATVTDIEARLIEMIRGFIVASLKEEQPTHEDLEKMVNYIKKNPEAFSEWASSDTALLFEDYTFENEKESKGFWF